MHATHNPSSAKLLDHTQVSLVPCASLAAQQRDHGVVPEIAPYVAWCNRFRAPGTLDGMTLALAIGLADSNWPLEGL